MSGFYYSDTGMPIYEISNFLKLANLHEAPEDYNYMLTKAGIDVVNLPTLTDAKLVAAGVEKPFHRLRLVKHAKKVKQQKPPPQQTQNEFDAGIGWAAGGQPFADTGNQASIEEALRLNEIEIKELTKRKESLQAAQIAQREEFIDKIEADQLEAALRESSIKPGPQLEVVLESKPCRGNQCMQHPFLHGGSNKRRKRRRRTKRRKTKTSKKKRRTKRKRR